MLSGLSWLALEVQNLERARTFYTRTLDLPVRRTSAAEVVLEAGRNDLVLRRPTSTPRGGLHTHYAFSTPADRYDDWIERLKPQFDLVEHDFGGAKSLYFFDPDGHCVEIGQSRDPVTGAEITGIFEIVLEVESLRRAERFYRALDGRIVDRGSARRRTRLDAGPVDIELWEPQLGIADARGGVHVDIGFETDSPRRAADRVSKLACRVEDLGDSVRVRDPDGHFLTFLEG